MIVRYLGSQFATGGSVASGTGSAAGYTLHTFTTTGTVNGTSSFVVGDLSSRLGATVSGVLSGTGNLAVNATGLVELSGSNTFTGDTTVSAGTLRLGNRDALGQSTFTGGAGALSFGGLSAATFGGLSGSNNLALTNTSSGGVALSLGGNNKSTTYSGRLSGAGAALTKLGTGTLTLTGSNTYGGNTTINGGRLVLGTTGKLASGTIVVGDATSANAVLDLSAFTNVSQSTLTTFDFGSGQTVKGKGTIVGSGTGSIGIAGVLSPGNSPGLITFQNTGLSLADTSTVLMEITGSTRGVGYDAVDITNGGLTYGGTLQLSFSQFFDSGTFNLFSFTQPASLSGLPMTIQATGSFQGTFVESLSTPGLFTLQSNNKTLEFRQEVQNGSTYYGQLVVVPEPLTLGLLGVGSGVAVLGVRRYRRRRAAGGVAAGRVAA